ncbi:glycosyl hydrolase [Gordoniibacillus kamchatkensis]|uniref:Glycosyl hydrolase n=1 Tax=Gordoniibacillus kamchatkensis TaxID=1590651 RepID=A0ABR5AAN2_9BACL|nr:glycosyl hydrolase [Paenibacillus sp. VKM B-2647]
MRQPRRRGRKTAWLLLLAALCAVATFVLWTLYAPNRTHVRPDFHGLSKPVFYKGELWEESAAGTKESLKLPASLIKQWIDPNALYEEKSDSFIVTTDRQVLRMKTSELTATVNDKPITLKFPVEKQGKTVLVPIEPLRDLYRVDLREADDTGAVILVKEGDVLQWAKASGKSIFGRNADTAALRTGPSIKEPIVADVKNGDKLMLWGEKNGWYEAQLPSGVTGYIRKEEAVLDHVETVPRQEPKPAFVPWKPLGGKINLTWEQVTTKTPDPAKIGPMPGLNVISPTWFSLADGDGTVQNIADPAYVKWAQGRGYQVWALFSNGFDPKRTTDALATYDKRLKIIKQLLGYVQLYKLQGINIDFENVTVQDKDELTQFVRELTPYLHELNAVVSIDVTPKSGSENWSLFYDRKALAQTVDYMMMMTYDEYWASSPKAGSVASLPWVEKSVAQILNEDQVPPSKLVLGAPYYTRIWTEETKDGKTTVTSKAVGMDAVRQLIKDKKLTPAYSPETGQNYVEYTDSGKLNRIWIEDETSMKARIELVKKYDLAGVALWKRGLELPETWTWIKDTLEKKP